MKILLTYESFIDRALAGSSSSKSFWRKILPQMELSHHALLAKHTPSSNQPKQKYAYQAQCIDEHLSIKHLTFFLLLLTASGVRALII